MSEHVKSSRPHLGPVRFSRLKKIVKSPAHYVAQFREPDGDSAAKRSGRLVHAAVLGGDVSVYDGKGNRNSNEYKDFAAANQDREICLATEWREAMRVAEAIDKHDDARLLLAGAREQEIAWTLEGRACGARLDVVSAATRSVTELKTTASAEPGWFQRNGARMGYHAQLDWYRSGAEKAYGQPFNNAYIVAVEPFYPFVITTFELDLAALDNGRRLWRSWWEKLRRCEEANEWPPYRQARETFTVREDLELDFSE